MLIVQVFIYLQVLDFLTTMVGFKLGAHEASPFIVKLIHISSPALGVGASKMVALAIAGVCVVTNRLKMLSLANTGMPHLWCGI